MYNNRSFNSNETQAKPAFMLMSRVLSDNCSVYSRDHSFTQVICLNSRSCCIDEGFFSPIPLFPMFGNVF